MATEPNWTRIASHVRSELNRADLTDRQSCVAEVLVKATLARKRSRVRILRLDGLGAALGLSKGGVHGTLFGVKRADGSRSSGLVGLGIVQFEKLSAGGAEYRIMADSGQWSVGWRYEVSAMDEFLAELDCLAGQVQGELLEPEPDLRSALAEVSIERANAGLAQERPVGMVSPVGELRDGPFEGRFHNVEPTTPLKLDPVPHCGTVPQSGTAAVRTGTEVRTMQSLKLQSSKDRAIACNFETLKGAVHVLGDPDEKLAMAAIQAIIGEEAMINDGGKWRNRWRSDREKVHRVFASLVGDCDARPAKNPSAYAEWLWRDMV